MILDNSESGRAVATTGERDDERFHCRRIEGTQRRKSPSPLDRIAVTAALLGAVSQLAQCRRDRLLESRTLSCHPLIELRRARDVETVEKRPIVQLDDALEIVIAHGLLEVRNVGCDELRVDSQDSVRQEEVVEVRDA